MSYKFEQEQVKINENVARHLEVANCEMATVKTDISWLKDTVNTHSTLLWSILGTIIIGFLGTIVAVSIFR